MYLEAQSLPHITKNEVCNLKISFKETYLNIVNQVRNDFQNVVSVCACFEVF